MFLGYKISEFVVIVFCRGYIYKSPNIKIITISMCISMEEILEDFEKRGEEKGKQYVVKDGQIIGLKYEEKKKTK